MDEIAVRYLGADAGGAYIEGIPARDLTAADWARVRAELRALALASGLYELMQDDATALDDAPPQTAESGEG